MNCALTVEKSKPGSHIELWSWYTDNIIKYISETNDNIIFVLWGNFAKKKNPDLWKRFLKIYPKHSIKFVWVKGHAGNELNEVADRLAVSAYQEGILEVDEFYEATNVD